MSIESFEQLLASLPDCDRFPTSDTLPTGVSYINEEMPKFVHPYLTDVVVGDSEATPQILIVSAPGAVGKSTLARRIAFEKRALLWDLALAPEVGSGSLDGTIFKSLSTGLAEDFREYMTEGLQFLIVDALDEGRIKVNENSFQRLLEDIARVGRNSKGICFVLLGRTRIADMAWLVLTEEGANARMVSIEPFNREQANQYIDNNVAEQKRTTPFYRCRDLIFQRLEFSVTENSESDPAMDFLHYPPVLDVVATLLKDESNLFELENSLNRPSDGTQDTSIHLLLDVIDRILKREQNQVLPAIKQSLNERAQELNWSDWASLYASEEQCKRLLASVFDKPVSVVPDNLPDGLRYLYENSSEVATRLPEHPFLQGVDKLTNRVFESYLYARALLNDFGDDVKLLVTQHLLKREHLPTRLLAAFYLADGNITSDMPRTIRPEHLGIIYDSLLSSESNRSLVRLNVDGPDPMEDVEEGSESLESVEVEIEFLTFNSQGGPQTPALDPVTFTLPIESDSIISFVSHLRNASITVPCVVELGSKGGEVTIGPTVHITAGILVLQSETLLVSGQTIRHVADEDTSVILEALNCDSTSIVNPLKVYEPARLHVSWPGAEHYPWNQYKLERVEDYFAYDSDLLTAYKRFKRIATAFRSHGRGALARTRVKIEDHRVLKGALGEALLDNLKSDGILVLQEGGNRYFWHSENADKLLGVTWQDLRKWETPPLLRKYLSDFIEQNQGLF